MGYGKCPICGADGVARERSPNGDTICANGHKTKSTLWIDDTPRTVPLSSLQQKLERCRAALQEVMTWIDNWNCPFKEDEDWPEAEEKARAALKETE